jgi:hypothetical protein
MAETDELPKEKIETLIPKLSEEELEARMARIKPMIRFSSKTNSKGTILVQDAEGDLYYIADIAPGIRPFTCEPTNPTTQPEDVNQNSYKSIRTYHYGGAAGRFMPSIGDVLAQIPEEDLERCVAFEVLGPIGFIDGTRDYVAETKLYEKYPQRVLDALAKTG